MRRLTDEQTVPVMRAAGLEPLEPYPGGHEPWRCRCLKCDHEVSPSYKQIRQGNGGCGWCSGKRIDPAETVKAMRAAGLEPLEPYSVSNNPWRCRCLKCDREVTPTYATIKQGNGGCVWCAGKRVDPAEAVEAMRAAGLEPLEPYAGSSGQWRCRCLKCDREVTPRYKSIQQGNGGCGWCAGKRVDPAEAVEAMRAAGLEPLEPFPGTGEPWRCRCLKCDREVTSEHSNIQQGGGGCVWCAGQRVDPTEVAESMRAAGLEPLEPYSGSNNPWRCRCLNCSREVTPTYSKIQGGRGGCVWCAGQRVDPTEVAETMRAARLEPLEP